MKSRLGRHGYPHQQSSESNKLTKADKVVYEDMLKSPERKKWKAAHACSYASWQKHRPSSPAGWHYCTWNNRFTASLHYCMRRFQRYPISYTHRTIAQDLDDAFTQSGRGLGISYNQNRFYFRIDNILTSKNLRAYNCTVDRSIKESDHYPIWCYITKRYWKLILKHLILRKQCSKNVF